MALQIEFPLSVSLWYLSPLFSPLHYLSSLYNLAADKLSLSYISALYHCQLKEWGAFALYVIQFLPAKLSHCCCHRHSLLTSLGACHILHLPGS